MSYQIENEATRLLFDKYKELFGVATYDEVDGETIEKIFITVRKDFFSKKISVDAFSNVCNCLFTLDKVNHLHLMATNSQLEAALEAGFELSYYLTQMDEDGKKWNLYFKTLVEEYVAKN